VCLQARAQIERFFRRPGSTEMLMLRRPIAARTGPDPWRP